MRENSVDLPAPFRPSNITNAPCSTVSETLSSTFVSPKLWLTPLTTRAGVLSDSVAPSFGSVDDIVVSAFRSREFNLRRSSLLGRDYHAPGIAADLDRLDGLLIGNVDHGHIVRCAVRC